MRKLLILIFLLSFLDGKYKSTLMGNTTFYISSKLHLEIKWNNPFNPLRGKITKIEYGVGDRNRLTRIRIFDISGRLVQEFEQKTAEKGKIYTIDWNGRDRNGRILPSGKYIVSLDAEGQYKTKLVVIYNR